MSAHTSADWLSLFVTGLVVIFLASTFKRQLWEAPLNHGPRFFLGIEVSEGFYEGVGVRWLRRYHTICLAVVSIEALALLAVLVSGRWYLFPVWAGGTSILMAAAFWGFTGYTRRTLGAHPPVRTSFAIPFEERRLGDYISWPAEVLIALVTVFSWALLLIKADAQLRWQVPVVLTYVVVGLFPFKIGIVRGGFPIPADRPEEHHRWMEIQRRHSLCRLDYFRWFFVVLLGGYALLHGWHMAVAAPWFRWFIIAVALAVWIVLTVTLFRGGRRMTEMGRDLRPVGSWSTPFSSARLMTPGVVPFLAWFGGLLLLLVFFRR